MTWLPALEQKLWRTTETCLLCSHNPGSLRAWQRHLLTTSHSRIANEAKMTWYHLYLVMSIHDDRMHPGLSIMFVASAYIESRCVCHASSPTPQSGAAGQGARHHKQVRMNPALCRRMQLCSSSSWLMTFRGRNDAQFRSLLGRHARQRPEVLGTPDLPLKHQLPTLISACTDKQSRTIQGEPRMHHHDFKTPVTSSPDKSRWRTRRWKVRKWPRRSRTTRRGRGLRQLPHCRGSLFTDSTTKASGRSKGPDTNYKRATQIFPHCSQELCCGELYAHYQ